MKRENMGSTENREEEMSKKINLLNKILDDIVDLNISDIERDVDDAINQGAGPSEILEKSLREGLKKVGERYEKGEYFLPELVMSVEAANMIMKKLKPKLISIQKEETQGRLVIGTVKGDLHDIGKNLVAALLKAAGFDVYDIGVDASSKKFVDAIKEYKPETIGMSALLTASLPMYEEVVKTLEDAGLRKKVKIIIGGGAASEKIARDARADAYAANAWEAARIAART